MCVCVCWIHGKIYNTQTHTPIDNNGRKQRKSRFKRERERQRKMCVLLFVSREIVCTHKKNVLLYDNNKFSTRRKSIRIHTQIHTLMLCYYTAKCGLCEMRTRSFMLLISFVSLPLCCCCFCFCTANT